MAKGDILPGFGQAAFILDLFEVRVWRIDCKAASICIDECDIVAPCLVEIADGDTLPFVAEVAYLVLLPRSSIRGEARLFVDDDARHIAGVSAICRHDRAYDADLLPWHVGVEIAGKDKLRP